MALKRAMDIEDLLVWALRDQCVDKVLGKATGFSPGGGNVYVTLERAAGLGVSVDCWHAAAVSNGRVHADAERVYDALVWLADRDRHAAGLVILHGRAGTRPDAMADVTPRLVPVRRANGKPRIEMAGGKPAFCLVRTSPDPHLIEGARALYTLWWYALEEVARHLAGTLEAFDLTGPAAPFKPWEYADAQRAGRLRVVNGGKA